MDSSEIFLSNKAHLDNRVIKLATFEVIPFIQLIPRENGRSVLNNKTYFIDGLDGRLVEGFCEAYNCTWELTIKQDAQYGKVYENKTADGITGSLLNRQVDVAIGGIAGWYHLLPYFSFTSPMQPISVTCLTPQPRLLPSWTLAIRIYKTQVWILLLVTIVVIIVFTYVLLKLNNVLHNFLPIPFQVIGGLLLQPANLRVRSTSETIFSFSLIIFLFLVTNMYLAKAVSMRTNPAYAASIDTVDHLAASGLPWNAPHEAWKYSILSSEKPSIRKLLQTFRAPEVSKLAQIANEGDESLAIAFLAYGHYIIGNWINTDNVALYRLMQEDLYWEYELVWTTKTWPMYDALNEYIMRIVEANLQRYEELIVAQQYLNHRVQNVIAHSTDKVKVKRIVSKFQNIKGYLNLFLVGAIIACLVFAVEVLWEKKNDIFKWYKGR
ncbi:uncharacterized protein LOC120415938 [Culex pipiens pallens]|uniref:uncharacterized protein LOC120415938 n=1 Tax=Culex pipiens pallens TaxID=42434 RepID=UPI0022AA251E|nr:uncharacterized protein LOC120415938 [Culex pipiens pallens]